MSFLVLRCPEKEATPLFDDSLKEESPDSGKDSPFTPALRQCLLAFVAGIIFAQSGYVIL